MVGAESVHRGIGVMAYFPDAVKVHVGDTVHWVQNANEIHTVTFLGVTPQPPLLVPVALLKPPAPATPLSPLAFNLTAGSPTARLTVR